MVLQRRLPEYPRASGKRVHSDHRRCLINYLDENFEEHEEKITGLPARIVQHEYDHLEGVLYSPID